MRAAGAALLALSLSGCVAHAPEEAAAYPVPPRLVATVPHVAAAAPREYPEREIDPVFARCAACHTIDSNISGIGPPLAGVYGRAAASVPNYRYSEGLSASGLVWDAATLDRWLAGPQHMVPDTKMLFRGLTDPLDRAMVIAYLERHRAVD